MNSFQIYIHMLIIHLRLQIIIEEAILGPGGFVYFALSQINSRRRAHTDFIGLNLVQDLELNKTCIHTKFTLQLHNLRIQVKYFILRP